jgi:hypothetical protein
MLRMSKYLEKMVKVELCNIFKTDRIKYFEKIAEFLLYLKVMNYLEKMVKVKLYLKSNLPNKNVKVTQLSLESGQS